MTASAWLSLLMTLEYVGTGRETGRETGLNFDPFTHYLHYSFYVCSRIICWQHGKEQSAEVSPDWNRGLLPVYYTDCTACEGIRLEPADDLFIKKQINKYHRVIIPRLRPFQNMFIHYYYYYILYKYTHSKK